MNKSILKASKGDLKCKIDADKEEGYINPDDVIVAGKSLNTHILEKDRVIIELQNHIIKQEQDKAYLLKKNDELIVKIEDLNNKLNSLTGAFEKTIRGFLER